MSSHQLEIKLSTQQEPFLFPLPQGTCVIGSGEHAHCPLPNVGNVAAEHCQLRCTSNVCEIRDLGNGSAIWIGNNKLEANKWQTLQAGEEISIGFHQLTYVGLATAVAPEPEAERPTPPDTTPLPTPVAEPGTDSGGENGRFPPNPPPSYQPPFHPSHGDDMHSRYLEYMPGIYQDNPFTIRFLALLESILTPIEWNINNFDLFLDINTAPASFLPWLANWFDITFDHTWPEARQRQFLRRAFDLQAQRGTAKGLAELLEIYTGKTAVIHDQLTTESTFRVEIPLPPDTPTQPQIAHLIDSYKPAFTDYELVLTGSQSTEPAP